MFIVHSILPSSEFAVIYDVIMNEARHMDQFEAGTCSDDIVVQAPVTEPADKQCESRTDLLTAVLEQFITAVIDNGTIRINSRSDQFLHFVDFGSKKVSVSNQ